MAMTIIRTTYLRSPSEGMYICGTDMVDAPSVGMYVCTVHVQRPAPPVSLWGERFSCMMSPRGSFLLGPFQPLR